MWVAALKDDRRTVYRTPVLSLFVARDEFASRSTDNSRHISDVSRMKNRFVNAQIFTICTYLRPPTSVRSGVIVAKFRNGDGLLHRKLGCCDYHVVKEFDELF